MSGYGNGMESGWERTQGMGGNDSHNITPTNLYCRLTMCMVLFLASCQSKVVNRYGYRGGEIKRVATQPAKTIFAHEK